MDDIFFLVHFIELVSTIVLLNLDSSFLNTVDPHQLAFYEVI